MKKEFRNYLLSLLDKDITLRIFWSGDMVDDIRLNKDGYVFSGMIIFKAEVEQFNREMKIISIIDENHI